MQDDLDSLRAFVIAADQGQFQEAAIELSITQQAVSKRIASLEQDLGVRLFTRSARGAQLTIDGRAFLPHARVVLEATDRAVESVRPGRRALRVDVLGRRLAPTEMLRSFHRAHPDVEIDVVCLADAAAAIEAVQQGTVDAAFCALQRSDRAIPQDLTSMRVLSEPVEVLVGPAHHLGSRRWITPSELVGRRIWIPGIVSGTEWAAFYDELAAAFNLTIDATGPNFGTEHLIDVITESATLATFVGERTRIVWPAHQDLKRIPLRGPVPLYPWSLLWRTRNPHPQLETLRTYLGHLRPTTQREDIWSPAWA